MSRLVVATVTALSTTPVKGLRVCGRSEVTLTTTGVPDDRRFYLIDADGRMTNAKRVGSLTTIEATYDAPSARLILSFPDGTEVADTVAYGASVATSFFSGTRAARLVVGPWSEAISRHTGWALRLVEAEQSPSAVDRGCTGAVTLISEASLARLEQEAGGRAIDPRRFRMLVQVRGCEAHEEDEWVGRSLRIGSATVAVRGHVGRCLVTSRSPESGVVDLATLALLGYRRDLPTTEALAFGVYGEVLAPGRIALGDSIVLDSD